MDIAAHILAEIEVPAPESMAASFNELHTQGVIPEELAVQLMKAVGFRNISVHAYQEVDWAIVYSIATTRLSDFSSFAACIMAKLGQSPGNA